MTQSMAYELKADVLCRTSKKGINSAGRYVLDPFLPHHFLLPVVWIEQEVQHQ